MTAKEKAKELYNKMLSVKKSDYAAKESALIAVDEMIAVLEKLRKPEYTTFIEWEQLKTKEEADTMDGYEYIEFLQQVKQEINTH